MDKNHNLHLVKFGIDPIDYYVFMAWKAFALSERCQKMNENGTTWYFVAYRVLVEDACSSGIATERGMAKRVAKLIEAGLLETHPDNQARRQIWMRPGANYDAFHLIVSERKFATENFGSDTILPIYNNIEEGECRNESSQEGTKVPDLRDYPSGGIAYGTTPIGRLPSEPVITLGLYAQICETFNVAVDKSTGKLFNELTDEQKQKAVNFAPAYVRANPGKALRWYLTDRKWENVAPQKQEAPKRQWNFKTPGK